MAIRDITYNTSNRWYTHSLLVPEWGFWLGLLAPETIFWMGLLAPVSEAWVCLSQEQILFRFADSRVEILNGFAGLSLGILTVFVGPRILITKGWGLLCSILRNVKPPPPPKTKYHGVNIACVYHVKFSVWSWEVECLRDETVFVEATVH